MRLCRLNLAVNYVLFSVSFLTAKIIFTVKGDRGHSGDVLKCRRVPGSRPAVAHAPPLLPAPCACDRAGVPGTQWLRGIMCR